MTANKNKIFAAILLAISGAPLAAQYLMVYPSKDMFSHPTQNINYFKLDNSDFSEFDPVTIEWEVVGSPDSVYISGIGIVANKGSQQIVLGYINEITIAADFRGDIKTKTISTKVMPEIKEFYLGQGDQHIPKTIFGISEIGAYNHSNVGALSHVNFMAGVKIANDLNFSYDNLSNVSGLSSLTTVTNKLHLQKNKITNLAGLSSLVSVKDLVVNDNLITSLNGLENLRSAITLSFTLNPSLNDISAIAGVTSTPVYLYLDDRTFTRPIPVNSYFCQKLMAGVNKLYFVSTQSTDYNKVCR